MGQVIRIQGGQVCESTGRAYFNWSVANMGYQHWILLDNVPFASEVQVPVISWSFGSAGVGVGCGGQDCFWVQLGVKIFSSVHASAA